MNVQYGASNWSHSMASMGYTNSGTYRRGFSLKHRVLHPSLTEQNPARFNWGFTHTFGTVWEKMVALPAAVTPVVVPRWSTTAIDSTNICDHANMLFLLGDNGYLTRRWSILLLYGSIILSVLFCHSMHAVMFFCVVCFISSTESCLHGRNEAHANFVQTTQLL